LFVFGFVSHGFYVKYPGEKYTAAAPMPARTAGPGVTTTAGCLQVMAQ
jgi:hypothetical protein